MSKWFVFKKDDTYHVLPCTDAGEVLPPHESDPQCVCKPYLDDKKGGFWVHNDRERGGANA